MCAPAALDSCNVAITKVLNFGSAPSCACHCWSHDGFLYAICVGKTVHVTSSDRSFGIRALVHFLSDPRDICVSFLPDCSVIAVAAATARGIELCFDDSRPPLCLAPLSAAVCVDMVLIESDNRMVVAGVGTDGRACVWEVNLEGKAHAEVVFKSALPLTSQRPTHAKLCRKDGIISLVVATWDGGMFQGSSASLTAQQISPSGSAVEPSAEMISRSKAGHGPSLVYQNPNDFSMLVANSSSREICRIGSELTPIGCPSFEGTLVGFTCVSIRSSCECGTTRKFVVVATTTPHQLVTIPLDSLAATHPPILVTGGWEVSAEEATHDEKPHVRLVVRQSSTFDIVEPGLELTWVTASNDVGLVCCSDEPQSFWVVTSQACLQSQTFPGLLAALSSHMTSQQLLCTLVRLETGSSGAKRLLLSFFYADMYRHVHRWSVVSGQARLVSHTTRISFPNCTTASLRVSCDK